MAPSVTRAVGHLPTLPQPIGMTFGYGSQQASQIKPPFALKQSSLYGKNSHPLNWDLEWPHQISFPSLRPVLLFWAVWSLKNLVLMTETQSQLALLGSLLSLERLLARKIFLPNPQPPPVGKLLLGKPQQHPTGVCPPPQFMHCAEGILGPSTEAESGEMG